MAAAGLVRPLTRGGGSLGWAPAGARVSRVRVQAKRKRTVRPPGQDEGRERCPEGVYKFGVRGFIPALVVSVWRALPPRSLRASPPALALESETAKAGMNPRTQKRTPRRGARGVVVVAEMSARLTGWRS